MPAEKLSKKKLLDMMDEKLQQLNLLRSALNGDPARKQEELVAYKKKFDVLMNKVKK